MDVKENIRQIIQKKGLKSNAVAEQLGFSHQQFYDMLAGRKIIRAEYVPRIAEALGVSVTEIFKEE